MTLKTAPASLYHFLLGKNGEEACGGPTLLVCGRRKSCPDQLDAGQTQLAEQQINASGVDLVGRFHAASPRFTPSSS
jgi:hypothetical protein